MKSFIISVLSFIALIACMESSKESKSEFLSGLRDSIAYLPGEKNILESGDTIVINIDTRPDGISSIGWIDLHNMLVLYEIYKIQQTRDRMFSGFYKLNYLIPKSGMYLFSYTYRNEDIYSSVDEFVHCNALYVQSKKIINIDIEKLTGLNQFCSDIRRVDFPTEGNDMEDFVNVAYSTVLGACNNQPENKYIKFMSFLRSFFELAYQDSGIEGIGEFYQITDDIYGVTQYRRLDQ